MKSRFLKFIFVIALMGLTFGVFGGIPVLSHSTGPCNDSDGDGSFSGQEYAKHHISAFARDGQLGNDAHKPGTHRGFSVCLLT